MKKRIISRILVFCLMCGILSVLINAKVSAHEETLVTEEEAYGVALSFIKSNAVDALKTDPEGDLYAQGIKEIESEGYPKQFAVESIEKFYDADRTVSAYYMHVVDKSGVSCGYVIISANRKEYPIIEYAYKGEFFLKKATDIIFNKSEVLNREKKKITIYYLGGFSYATELGSQKYCLNDGGIYKVKKIKKGVKKYSDENSKVIEMEWDKLSMGGSNPPVGSVITTPDNYEGGYSKRTADYCSKMGTTYYQMTDFSDGMVCSPTAATNLCLYWTRRNSSYGNLCNGNWQNTFNRLFDLMGTNKNTGTKWPNPTRKAILNYFKERGLKKTEAYYVDCKTTDDFNAYIKAEINVGRPVILATTADSTYKDHTML